MTLKAVFASAALLASCAFQLSSCIMVDEDDSGALQLLQSPHEFQNGAMTCIPGSGNGSESCGAPCPDIPAINMAAGTTSRRVRREIRSLVDSQWQAVVDAMWTMKTTSGEEGVAKYGDAYRPYDYFTARHTMVALDPRGDQAHLSAAFSTWHGGIVLEFENALLAVDPSIEGMPYWDVTVDEASDPVFNDKYLGSFPGVGPNSTLEDGAFAGWTVPGNFSLAYWANYSLGSAIPYGGSLDVYDGNPGGFLRSPGNYLNSSVVTRYGSMFSYAEADFQACITDAVTLYDWTFCIHLGTTADGANVTKTSTPGVLPQGLHPGPHIILGGTLAGSPVAVGGDFEDVSSSPNDPLFMFHHANMDRSRMWYQQQHPVLAPVFWGFPATNDTGFARNNGNRYYGIDLHDTADSNWPFTKTNLGLGKGGPEDDVALTHAGLLCLLSGDAASYVYDDILEHTQCGQEGCSTPSSTLPSHGYPDDDDSSAPRVSGGIVMFTLLVNAVTGLAVLLSAA